MSDLTALNLEPGEVVGGYTLVSRLGSGAMGSVWRVRDDGGTNYAMKILRDSLVDDSATSAASEADGSGAQFAQPARPAQPAHDPNLKADVTPRERLRREAMALKKVNHPGVCGIVDMELDDSLAFIVTELIEGKNLRDDVAANGRYIGDDLERLARKLIDATKAVHAAGIIHRDIKPTNVMVSATGPVLVDFGIAMGEGESHVTRTGLVMGTPGFIAPEIIEGAEADEMTDWWSVASVLAFAATGTPVFGTKPMMAVLERAASGNANLTGLPAGTLAAFRAALDPDRSKRCTPDQLLHAIALDAMNPYAWQDAQAGPFGSSAFGTGATGSAGAGAVAGAPTAIVGTPKEATEVMPPFGAEPDEDNPRTLWRVSDTLPTSSLPTSLLPPEDAPTIASAIPLIPDNAAGTAATAILPAISDDSVEATKALPGESNEADEPTIATTRTRLLPSAASTEVLPPALPPTATLPPTAALPPVMPPTLPPSLPPTSTRTPTPTPPAAVPPAFDPAVRPAMQRVIDQTAQAVPTEALMQRTPAPNPADIRRGAYLQRGTLPLFLLAIPLSALSASFPIIGAAAAVVMLWLLLVLSYNEEAQLEREGRRGGERKGSDALIRTATLPWHLIKGLLFAIPRAILLLIIDIVGVAVASVALALPVNTIPWYVTAGWGFGLPLLSDVPLSTSGMALAGFMAVGWLVTVFGPQAMMMRLGAGVLRGLKPQQIDAINAAIADASGARPAMATGAGSPTAPAPTALAQPTPGPSRLNGFNPLNGAASPMQPVSPPARGHRGTVMFTIWLILSLACAGIPLIGMPISWFPLI